MMEEDPTNTAAQSQSNGIAIAEPVNCNNVVVNKSIKGAPGPSNGLEAARPEVKNSNNNNEDTSISSSVMSDSGEEIEEDPILEPDPVAIEKQKKQPNLSKAATSKKPSLESETSEDEVPVRHEKER